jgi:hypothetical protein
LKSCPRAGCGTALRFDDWTAAADLDALPMKPWGPDRAREIVRLERRRRRARSQTRGQGHVLALPSCCAVCESLGAYLMCMMRRPHRRSPLSPNRSVPRRTTRIGAGHRHRACAVQCRDRPAAQPCQRRWRRRQNRPASSQQAAAVTMLCPKAGDSEPDLIPSNI